MEYRNIGNSGLKSSVFALGGWRNFGFRLDDKQTDKIIRTAVDAGITTFDTADVYGPAEAAMGNVFQKLKRSDLVIATKCYWPISDNINDRGLSRKHIRESVEQSLTRLKTDYVDLFLCHRFDEETPLRETIRTFDDLIRQGKILYWGSSAWQADQLEQAIAICEQEGYEPPIVEQSEFSLVHPEPMLNDVQVTSAKHGIGLMCWSPLAAGLLAGKNLNGIEPSSLLASVSAGLSSKYHNTRNIEKAKRMQMLATQWHMPMASIALQWLLQQTNVASIVMGVSSLTQLQENLASLTHTLTTEQLAMVNDLFQISGEL